MVLWFTGLAVAVVNNVALVAPMNALILQIRHDMLSAGQAAIPAAQFQALWWALSLGACLGANYTPVATAANVVLTDIAHRSGYPIPFVRFLKYSMPITTVSLLVATVYLWLVFFR
jgi:Na+/H+ antiporter NhaD/arsenite permease-like protein